MSQIQHTLLCNNLKVEADIEQGFLRDGCYYTVSSGSGLEWEKKSGLRGHMRVRKNLYLLHHSCFICHSCLGAGWWCLIISSTYSKSRFNAGLLSRSGAIFKLANAAAASALTWKLHRIKPGLEGKKWCISIGWITMQDKKKRFKWHPDTQVKLMEQSYSRADRGWNVLWPVHIRLCTYSKLHSSDTGT